MQWKLKYKNKLILAPNSNVYETEQKNRIYQTFGEKKTNRIAKKPIIILQVHANNQNSRNDNNRIVTTRNKKINYSYKSTIDHSIFNTTHALKHDRRQLTVAAAWVQEHLEDTHGQNRRLEPRLSFRNPPKNPVGRLPTQNATAHDDDTWETDNWSSTDEPDAPITK